MNMIFAVCIVLTDFFYKEIYFLCVIQCIDFLSIANNTVNFNGLLEYKLQYQQVVHHFCITRCTHVNTFENYVDHIVLHCAKKNAKKKTHKKHNSYSNPSFGIVCHSCARLTLTGCVKKF